LNPAWLVERGRNDEVRAEQNSALIGGLTSATGSPSRKSRASPWRFGQEA
jgi:hypothetical protein